MYESNSAYNYSDSGEYNVRPRINGLELILVLIALVSIIIVGIWGFNAGTIENQDLQKQHDISEITKTLDFFYAKNGNYPIRECSENLNPIDFEYTLRRNLTGKVAKVGNENYIKTQQDFPTDRTGSYSSTFEDYIYNIPCLSIVSNSSNKKNSIYPDNTKACNYNQTPTKTENNPKGKIASRCYLYTSSVNGDNYSIGYYSETLKRFVIISKFRTDKSTISYG